MCTSAVQRRRWEGRQTFEDDRPTHNPPVADQSLLVHIRKAYH